MKTEKELIVRLKKEKSGQQLALKRYDKYDNIDIFLDRVKAYNPKGRMQTEDEARDKDTLIKKIIEDRGIKYVSYPGTGPKKAVEIADYIQGEIEKRRLANA